MMKCPTCGGPLKPSKKDPDYLLCYTCKKKFKVPQHQAEDVAPKTERMSAKKEAGRRDSAKKDSARKENVKKERSVREQKYSNIPPKEVRDKREREMKKAYDDMLSVEEEKVSKAPIIILAIAIIVVAAVAEVIFAHLILATPPLFKLSVVLTIVAVVPEFFTETEINILL